MSTSPAASSAPIFLVGMMGTGKSTIGPRLAARLGRSFVDTDHAVEARTGDTIAEIFERDGEARFRALEAEAIDEASRENAVVALGGGAIAQPGAAERLLERGAVVWLRVDLDRLVERIGDASSRPLLAGLDRRAQRERLAELETERRHHYERATLAVDASLSITEVVDEIVAGLAAR